MSFWKVFKRIINGITVIITLLNFFFKVDRVQQLVDGTLIANILAYRYFNRIAIIILTIFILLGFISFFLDRSKSIEVGNKNHEFFHELRNCCFSARDVTGDSQNSYNKIIKESSEKLCKIICEYFYLKYNKNFNVCVKMVDITSSRTSTSINEIMVKTLARGGKDKIDRERQDINKKVFVKDDTSYFQILSNEKSGRKSDYICTNLPLYCIMKKASGDSYLPPFKSFYRKYLSTVVVPIRIDSSILPKDSKYINSDEKRYQVFGFLCLDYKLPISKNLSKCLCTDLKAFADSLYMVYDEVIKANIKYEKDKDYFAAIAVERF